MGERDTLGGGDARVEEGGSGEYGDGSGMCGAAVQGDIATGRGGISPYTTVPTPGCCSLWAGRVSTVCWV